MENKTSNREHLRRIESEYMQRGLIKTFWAVVRGITGQGYKRLDDIPEEDIVDILRFFQQNKNMS